MRTRLTQTSADEQAHDCLEGETRPCKRFIRARGVALRPHIPLLPDTRRHSASHVNNKYVSLCSEMPQCQLCGRSSKQARRNPPRARAPTRSLRDVPRGTTSATANATLLQRAGMRRKRSVAILAASPLVVRGDSGPTPRATCVANLRALAFDDAVHSPTQKGWPLHGLCIMGPSRGWKLGQKRCGGRTRNI